MRLCWVDLLPTLRMQQSGLKFACPEVSAKSSSMCKVVPAYPQALGIHYFFLSARVCLPAGRSSPYPLLSTPRLPAGCSEVALAISAERRRLAYPQDAARTLPQSTDYWSKEVMHIQRTCHRNLSFASLNSLTGGMR